MKELRQSMERIMENSKNKEIERLLNEAYYDIDYGMSHSAKIKDESDKYLKQAMSWILEAKKLVLEDEVK